MSYHLRKRPPPNSTRPYTSTQNESADESNDPEYDSDYSTSQSDESDSEESSDGVSSNTSTSSSPPPPSRSSINHNEDDSLEASGSGISDHELVTSGGFNTRKRFYSSRGIDDTPMLNKSTLNVAKAHTSNTRATKRARAKYSQPKRVTRAQAKATAKAATKTTAKNAAKAAGSKSKRGVTRASTRAATKRTIAKPTHRISNRHEYRNPSSIVDDSVLSSDEDGVMWVGHMGGEVDEGVDTEDADDAEDAVDADDIDNIDTLATDIRSAQMLREFNQSGMPEVLSGAIARQLLERLELEDDPDYTEADLAHEAGFSDLSKKEQKRIQRSYKELSKEISEETPTVQLILDSNMSRGDKKKCLEKYHAFQMLEENSFDYIEAKHNILKFMRDNVLLDPALEREQQRLKDIYNEQTNLRESILRLNAPDHVKSTIYAKYEDLTELDKTDRDYASLKTWIEWAVSIPYSNIDNKITQLHTASPTEREQFFIDTKAKLDTKLHGMDGAKREIMCLLNNYITSGQSAGTALAMVGDPGVGKTTIAKTLAEALDMPFDKIDLGGIHDPATLMGHDDTYIGASPGLIVKILKRMKYSNGIVLFDEIDKLGASKNGRDVQYALLHITDFTQNKEFRDTYLSEIKIDLSNIWFIYAMNDISCMDAALLDRLPVIKIPNYSADDKINIVLNHAMPEICEQLGLTNVTMRREAAEYLVRNAPSKQGVRKIKDKLKAILDRISFYQRLPPNSSLVWFKIPKSFDGEITSDVIRSIDINREEDDDISKQMMYT